MKVHTEKTRAQVIQPRYYKHFTCIGGECPLSCCFGWASIEYSKEEVEKLKKAECSEELRSLIDISFKENPLKKDKYTIKYDDNDRCPFLTEDNFCAVQRELGADYLSLTCQKYPRKDFWFGNKGLRYCNTSCYHIFDTLLNDSHCMELESFNEKSHAQYHSADSAQDIAAHPELKYRYQLFDFFYNLISNDSRSVETSLLLGAFAATNLTEAVNAGQSEAIPQLLDQLRSIVNKKIMADKLEEIQPNYANKVLFAYKLFEASYTEAGKIFNSVMEKNGSVDVEKYKKGIELFNKDFADKPFALRNIALQLLLDMKVPFRDINHSLFDNYCYYIAAAALIKAVGPAIYANDYPDPLSVFKKVSSYIFRSFSHNDANVEPIIQYCKDFKCENPANLAAIIK